MSTYALINKYNISNATIMKIDDFCRILDCEVSDVIEYIKE